jgi:cytochrome c-type biogenesis protein CcmE
VDVVVRVLVMTAVAVGYYLTRGFGHSIYETFAMSCVAVAGGHAASLVVRFLRRDPKVASSHALAAAVVCIAVLGAGIALAVTRPHRGGPLPFVRVDELRDHRGDEVKLHGIVQRMERKVDGDDVVTRIHLAENGVEVVVEAHGPLPDTLRERAEMVARGTLDGDIFVATEVMAKCPDSYQTPDGPVPAARFRK